MVERIQKIISARGVASRRHAEEMILAGRVSCNGCICHLGDKADSEKDLILIDGKKLPQKQERTYLLLHKPRGYVTTLSDEKGRRNVAQLVADCGVRVYPVGRLDMDSEGLLLLTDDGELAQHLMHPRHQVNKVYLITVLGFSQEALERIARPIVLDGYRIKKPQISLISQDCTTGRAKLQIVIHEGRNRQVRRMCSAAGMEVVRLIRIQEDNICLGDLPCGKWRYLTKDEIRTLLE